jgi:cytoskeletal protein CcmA (bactofilin family)
VSLASKHHDRAMELADEADSLRRKGQRDRSIETYRLALTEEEAIRLSGSAGAGVKTLSVLHRSAASLAIDSHQWTKARRLIDEGLAIDPPDSIRQELRELSEKATRLATAAPIVREAVRGAASFGLRNILLSEIKIKGSLRSGSDLVFHGSLEGEIDVDGELTIGEDAEVIGDIRARSVKIQGKVKGNILAKDSCHMFPTGVLTGDLTTRRLIFEEGASFVGFSSVTPFRARATLVEPAASDLVVR